MTFRRIALAAVALLALSGCVAYQDDDDHHGHRSHAHHADYDHRDYDRHNWR